MKLVASAIIRNERHRYLEPWVDHLLDFCDQIVVIDDASDDSLPLSGSVSRRFISTRNPEPMFFEHEGRARQHLLDVTMAVSPTHVIALDADEFVADGPGLRRTIEANPALGSWWLEMQEVWELDNDCLCVRFDGGWLPHAIPAVWRVPGRLDATWRIRDRALACGRVPAAVDASAARLPAVTDILHFGWANPAERQARYDRYTLHDGGRFHASQHLQSIMWPADRVDLRGRAWPVALAPHRAAISGRAGVVGART